MEMPLSQIEYSEHEPQPCAGEAYCAMDRNFALVCGSPLLSTIIYDISLILLPSGMLLVDEVVTRGTLGSLTPGKNMAQWKRECLALLWMWQNTTYMTERILLEKVRQNTYHVHPFVHSSIFYAQLICQVARTIQQEIEVFESLAAAPSLGTYNESPPYRCDAPRLPDEENVCETCATSSDSDEEPHMPTTCARKLSCPLVHTSEMYGGKIDGKTDVSACLSENALPTPGVSADLSESAPPNGNINGKTDVSACLSESALPTPGASADLSESAPPTPRSLRGTQLSDTESEGDIQTVHLRFYSVDGSMLGEETYTLNNKVDGYDSTLGNVLAKARLLTQHPCAEVIMMGRQILCSKKPYFKLRNLLDDAEIVPLPDRKGDTTTTFAYSLLAQVVVPSGRYS